MVSVGASTIVAMSAGAKSSPISAMSTGSASQPTDVKVPIGDAYQRAVAKVRIGNFNMGISQSQFTSRTFKRKLKFALNICRVVHTAFDDGELDILGTCEFGKHKEGPSCTDVNISDLLKTALGEHHVTEIEQNYVTIFAPTNDTQSSKSRIELWRNESWT